MASRFLPTDLTSTYSAIAALNANFQDVADLLDKCLFRDGTGANSMSADLDMNHFVIRNAGAATSLSDAPNWGQVLSVVNGGPVTVTSTSTTDNHPKRLTYGGPVPVRTVRQAHRQLDLIHTTVIGPAKTANTIGGFGKTKYYVNNPSLDESIKYSFGWAMLQAKNNNGGLIYFDTDGQFDVEFMDNYTIDFNNVTVYAPGCNVTFWMDRLSGHINITSGSNWIFKNIYFRTNAGPINGTAVGELVSHAHSLINIHSDVCDQFAFLNCEFRHPSWHCIDITRDSPIPGNRTCNVSFQNCIMWDAIQGHLLGTDNAKFETNGWTYTDNNDTRELYVLFYENIWAYNLQRNPKVLGNAYVDMVDCLTLLRPYETEYEDYVDSNGTSHTYDETVMLDVFGGAVQDGGWLNVRGSLFVSTHASSNGMPATHLMPGFPNSTGATGRIAATDSDAENLVFELNESDQLGTLPYTLAHTPIADAGDARDEWIAGLWSRCGARRDSAPDGDFIWSSDTSLYPNGETILIERGESGRWLRVDPLREYPAPTDNNTALETAPRSYTRTVGYTQGKSTLTALGTSTLDLADLDSNWFVVSGNGTTANLKFVMTTDDATVIPDGLVLRLSGSSSTAVTLKTSSSIVAGTVDAAADTIVVTGHGMVTGDWPVYFTSTTTMPGGVTSKQAYYAIVVNTNTIKLATSYADAVAGNAVNITSAGSGTIKANVGSFNLPNGADVVLDRTSALTTLVWDAANVQWDVVSRNRIQAADITDVTLASGTYTPTLTATANCSALSVNKAQYSRNGSIVMCTIQVSGTQTTGSTLTKVRASLPIASNLASTADLIGGCNTNSPTPVVGYTNGDVATDLAEAGFVCTAASSASFILNMTFQYEIK